jgi:phosphatidate cytidylyltransferase
MRAKSHTFRDTPSKPSKTAIKKAAKAARQEKKQQNRVPSGGDTSERPSPASTLPHRESEVRLPTTSDGLPVEPPDSEPPKANTNPSPDGVSPTSNGDSVRPNVGSPRPDLPGQSPDLPSRSQRGPPPKVDQPPPQSPPASLPRKQMLPSSGSVSSPSNNSKNFAVSAPAKPAADPEADKSAKKGHNVLVRTLWTFIMIGGFLGQFHFQ